MSYIGNAPISAAFLTDTFSGTGSQTAFTMTVAPANTSSCIVAITGVLQDPSTYSVSGTTLTFSAAPPTGTSNISVRYLGIPASGVTTTAYSTVTDTTATAGQTSFTIPSYTVGYLEVFRNGVYLPNADYTATTGTTVVLTNAATAGDTITTISFYVSSVLNALPTTGGTISGNLVVTGTETVSTITSPAATALTLQTNNGTTALTLDASGRPLTPLRPAFNVNSVSNGSSLANSSIIIFGTATTNIGSNYSTSTGIFTAPVSGFYCFQTTILFQSLAASTSMTVTLGVNGLSGLTYNFGRTAYTANATGTSGYSSVSGSASLALNAGDGVAVYNNSGQTMSIYNGSEWSRFSGFLVG